MRDGGDPAANGFSVFVVQRHEQMKFAAPPSEIISSHKDVSFVSSLRALNERVVIKHVRCVFVVGRRRCF